VTERKAPKPPGATEEATMFDSPEPKSTATKKKKAAAPVVKRKLKSDMGLPTNKDGETECGVCRRVWASKFEFCKKHTDELEDRTYIVQEDSE